jgi:hypothetical protein
VVVSILNNYQAVKRLIDSDTRSLSLPEWLEAYAVAAAPGAVDAESESLLRAVSLKAVAQAVRAAVLDGGCPQLEVMDARGRDVHFDARCRALAGLAQPGDRIVWLCEKDVQPWRHLRATYGACLHISLVLPGGLLLDPYWPEGSSVATLEVACARALRRIQSRTACVLRAGRVLSVDDHARLLTVTALKLTYAYRLIAPLTTCRTSGSCAKVVWELHDELVLPVGGLPKERWFRSSICPGDLAGDVCWQVSPDGVVTGLAAVPDRVPTGWPFRLLAGLDWSVGHYSVVASGLRWLGDVLTTLVTPRLQANTLEHACEQWIAGQVRQHDADPSWTGYLLPTATADVMA